MFSFFNKSKEKSVAEFPADNFKSNSYLAFATLGQPAWTPRDYAALAREGYRQNPIAYRCVRLIAESVAAIPLLLKDASGKTHALQSLIDKPNFEQTRSEFVESFIGHLQIAGNAYIEMVAIDNQPKELIILRPDTMRIIKGKNNWIVGWEQQISATNKRKLWRDLVTGRSQVLHLKTFNPCDDLYGQSPIEPAATAIDIHNAGGAWNKSLIDNAARPSGALVYKGQTGSERLSDEQFARLKDELTFAHTGAANAGRPLLLEGGLEWAAMSLSPQEMDFVEARRQASRDIALAFGVPSMLLGIPGDNTYSNYKEANIAFYRQTIMPLMHKLATSMAAFLSAWADDEVTIIPDFDAINALSSERDNLWQRLEGTSFITNDEKRKLAGLSPLESGVDNV